MTTRVATAADGWLWLLDTPSTSYAIHLTGEDRLVNLHWGPRISIAGVYDSLHRLLAEHAIDYVKWDMNRPISEPGWPDEPDNPSASGWITSTTCTASSTGCAWSTRTARSRAAERWRWAGGLRHPRLY